MKFAQNLPSILSYSSLPITRTLAKSNLVLTRTKVDFPWFSFLHLLWFYTRQLEPPANSK